MATFAANVEPGTTVEVINQPVPPSNPPTFAAVLIGQTNYDKPTSKWMLRDSTKGMNYALNSVGGIDPTAGQGVADSLETIRRDLIDADSANVVAVTNIVDELGVGYRLGETFDWVLAVDTSEAFVEWVAQYSVPTPTITPAENLNCVELVGVSKTITAVVEPITIVDGPHTLDFTLTGNLLKVDAYSTGVDIGALAVGDYAVIPASATEQLIVRKTSSSLPAANEVFNFDVSTAGPRSGASTGGAGVIPDYPTNGSTKYQLAYNTLKTTDDLGPVRFESIAAVRAFHGDLTATTPTDHLSLGCVAYFNNGGAEVFCLPLHDDVIDPVDGWDITTESGYVSAVEEALGLLEEVNEVTCVIPLHETEVSATAGNWYPGILRKTVAHVAKMNGLLSAGPRVAMLGARANTVLEATFIESQQACGSQDVVYVCPATATLTTGGSTYTMNGANMAAGIAGIWSNPGFNSAEPVSGKSFVGFDSIIDPFTRLQKNRIGEQHGGTVIEIKDGATKIRHFLSTKPGNPLEAEAKMAKIRIDIRKVLTQALNATVINQRLTPTTVATAKSIIGLILNQKIVDRILNGYEITKMQTNPLEPRQLDVEVKVIPVFDLNWVYIRATFAIS